MYKITQAYCWYNRGEMIVKMYFINSIPFTFDELDKDAIYDLELVALADQQLRWEPEDIYRTSFYLIDEEAHPCLFELELENPECMPLDYD